MREGYVPAGEEPLFGEPVLQNRTGCHGQAEGAGMLCRSVLNMAALRLAMAPNVNIPLRAIARVKVPRVGRPGCALQGLENLAEVSDVENVLRRLAGSQSV